MTVASLESPSRTNQILDLLPNGALVIDEHLCILKWNRTLVEWTSISGEEAVGATLTTLFPNLQQPRFLERLTQVFEGGFPATYSAAFHKHFLPVPARHGLDCELMIQQTDVRRLDDGESKRALITIQDVSFQYLQLDQLKREQAALAKANQELVERNRELDDFTRIASHDLKAPLRKITVFGDMLVENLEDKLDDDSRELLGYMQDSATRMKQLIQDLMVLSSTSLREVKHEVLDLNQLVEEVQDTLAIAISEANATIEVGKLPTVEGDRRLVSQLYQNLIDNALKFSTEQPLIRIDAECDSEAWILSVQDNGIGIQETQVERIFEPFMKLHSRDEYPGSGFGLSICQKALAKLGGRIWVESTFGEGATFKFTLPVTPAES